MISCNRKGSFSNRISHRSCCRSMRPLAFPTTSPTIPARGIENGKRRSVKPSSWMKLPERGLKGRAYDSRCSAPRRRILHAPRPDATGITVSCCEGEPSSVRPRCLSRHLTRRGENPQTAMIVHGPEPRRVGLGVALPPPRGTLQLHESHKFVTTRSSAQRRELQSRSR